VITASLASAVNSGNYTWSDFSFNHRSTEGATKLIHLRFNPNHNRPDIISQPNQIQAFLNAMNEWNAALANGGANIRFVYDGVCNIDNINLAQNVDMGNHLFCDVYFHHTQYPGVIAGTWPFPGAMPDMISKDVEIYDDSNSDYTWVWVPDPAPTNWPPLGQVDLQSTIAHELGHVLCLGHAPYTAYYPPIMHIAFSTNYGPETNYRPNGLIEYDDRQGACGMYNFTSQPPNGGDALVLGRMANFPWTNSSAADYAEIGQVVVE
jgi:hypothetical protein